MGYANYIGRVGGLAIALGVGVAVATTPGVAWAGPTDSSASDSSSSTSSSSASSGSSEGSSGSNTESSGASVTGPSEPAGGEVAGSTTGDGAAAGDDASKSSDSSTADKKSTTVVKDKKSGSDRSVATAAPKKPKRSVVSTQSGGDTADGVSTTQRAATDAQPKVEPVTAPAITQSVVDVAPSASLTVSTVQDVPPAEPQPKSEVTPLASTLLSAVGLAPSADGDTPDVPGDSPLTLLGLAAFRRQTQQAVTEDASAGEPMLMAAALTANSAPSVPGQPTGIPNAVTGVVSGTVVATDPDGNTLTYSVSPTSAKGGAVSINPTTGAYTYTPSNAARLAANATPGADTDTFTVYVSDGQTTTTGIVPVYVSPAQWTTGTPTTVGNQPVGVAAYASSTDPTKNRTYVINQYDKTVSVIDTNPNSATYNKVVGTIKLASTPSDIVLNSTGTRAYVTTKGNASVAVINTVSMKVVDVNPATSTVDSIKVGSTPTQIAISPDDSRLYVTNGGSSTVSVIDTALNKEISRITVGSQPSGVAVSPDGQKLYVTLRYTDSLAVVNLANNTKTTIKVGDSPRDVALTPDGTRAFVTNYDGTVSVIDTTTKTQVAKIVTGGPKYQPVGVAISPDGTLAYVANGKDTVSVFDTKTNAIVQTITIDSAAESSQHWVAVDGSHVYVTDYSDDTLRLLSLTRGNTAPVAIANPTLGTANPSTGAITGLVNVKDPDGDTVTYTTVSAPTKGTVSYNPVAGTYTYTPTPAARQQATQNPGLTDTFTVRTADASGAFKDVSLIVNVEPMPTQPVSVSQTAVTVGDGPSGTAIVGNRAYVVNTGSNSVSVIDTTTKQVTQTITTGIGVAPVSVASSPNTNRVYVANQGDNTVSVIDTTTNTVVTNIAIPVQPYEDPYYGELPNYVTDLAVSADGKRVYTTATDGTISVINTDPMSSSFNTVTSTQPLGYYSDLKISPDGNRLYGTHYGYYSSSSTVDVIDTGRSAGDSMTSVGSIQVGPQWNLDAMQSEFTEDTYNVAVSPDGKRLYVTYGVTQVARGVGGQTSGEFIVDSLNRNWLVTGRYSAVSVIDIDPASATYNTEIDRITVPVGAQDVSLSPDGKTAYVTSWDGKTVTLIDTATNAATNSFTTDQTSTSPRYGFYGEGYFTRFVTVAPDGNLYISDYTDGKVYVDTVGSTAQQV